MSASGGGSASGPGGVCLWFRGECLPLVKGGVSASGPEGGVNRMADKCKNITFPQLHCGIIAKIYSILTLLLYKSFLLPNRSIAGSLSG